MGIRPSASTDEVRAAYLDLARRLHPDRLVDASPAERSLAERRMREINEAWRVLRDPSTRRAYDESRRSRPPGSSSAARSSGGGARPVPETGPRSAAGDDDEDLVDVVPEGWVGELMRHGPWVLLVVVLVGIFVVTAYATAGRSKDEPGPTTRGPVAAGTCLDVGEGAGTPTTQVVPCAGPHDVEVVQRVDDATPCPSGTERRRLATDGRLDCVVPGPAGR